MIQRQHIHVVVLRLPFLVELEFRNEYSEKKPLGAKERTTSISNHIWRRRRNLNLGHTGGRRVLSPLLHPCSRIVLVAELSIQCGSQTPVRTFPGLLFDPGLSNHDIHAPTKTGIVRRFSVLWLTSTITDQIIKRPEESYQQQEQTALARVSSVKKLREVYH